MTLERLWAGWRGAWVEGATIPPSGDGTLFERLLGSGRSDEELLVVHQGESCVAMLNAYPYSSGHVLVMPRRPAVTLGDLTDDEHRELWDVVRDASRAIEVAYRPEAMNIGANIGRAAGAGVPDHLHVHVVPRWSGDTSFLLSTADTRVMPEALPITWQKLRDAWPQ